MWGSCYSYDETVKTHYRPDGETCIMFADVYCGRLDAVKRHVENPDFAHGRFVAAKAGRMILPDANETFKAGTTMLRMACEGVQVEVVRFLLTLDACRAQVNQRQVDGYTPMDDLMHVSRRMWQSREGIIQIMYMLDAALGPGERFNFDDCPKRGSVFEVAITLHKTPAIVMHMIRLGARSPPSPAYGLFQEDKEYAARLEYVIQPRLYALALLAGRLGRRIRLSRDIIRRVMHALLDDIKWYPEPKPAPAAAVVARDADSDWEWNSEDDDVEDDSDDPSDLD